MYSLLRWSWQGSKPQPCVACEALCPIPYHMRMAKEPTADEAIARAKALQDSRLDAIRAVVQARQSLADVREATARELAELQARIAQRVGDAEREDVRAYNAALTAGWTPEELRRIGFGEPEKKARVRKRAARRSPTDGQRASARTPEQSDTTATDQGETPAAPHGAREMVESGAV